MKIEYISSSQLKNDLLKGIGRYIDLNKYKIFFFGSRVKGDNLSKSDIDLGIIGPRKIPAETKLLIQEKIEHIPTLYKIDFVDFNNVSKKFKKEASKYIEYIN